MTPLQLQMLLHYYTRPTPYAEHEPLHARSFAVKEQREELERLGLLEVCHQFDGGYGVTDRGIAYIEGLKSLPLPEKHWIIPGLASAQVD